MQIHRPAAAVLALMLLIAPTATSAQTLPPTVRGYTWDQLESMRQQVLTIITVFGYGVVALPTSTENTTCSLSISPQNIQPGQSATLSWTSSNASGVSIDTGIGYVATAGSVRITPAQTTTYHCVGYITNVGYGKNASATITVGSSVSGPTVAPSALNVPNVWTSNSTALDPTHLAMGDDKWSTEPRKGYIFACNPQRDYAGSVGAHNLGSWIHGTSWNVKEKIAVQGEVYWPNASFTISADGTTRTISGNDLPVNIPTGIYPVRSSDPAYAIDPNPSAITAQSVSFSVPVQPTFASAPSCVTIATIGYALDGVPFSSALDVQAHDAVAHEVQDTCSGHPRPGGQYHYHSLSNCIPHIAERTALVGYALDGYGIFSPYDAAGKELTTSDLDECHGITSPVVWEGKTTNMYHYVLTRDYPYTIGCFRGTPADVPLPPPPQPMQPPAPSAQLPSTTCVITATPATAYPGSGTTLRWSSSEADGVYIDNGIGYVGPFGATGITPSKTTTYSCVAYKVDKGYGPSASAVVTVVGSSQPPVSNSATTCSLSLSPSTVRPGQSATLSWTSSHADGVSIDNSVGYVGTSGSVQVTPYETTTYYCVGYIVNQGYGPQSKPAKLTVSGEPVSSVEKDRLIANALTAMESLLRSILTKLTQ